MLNVIILIILLPIVVSFITLLSGYISYIVGLFFGNQILNVFSQLGLTNVSMFDIGLCMGFIFSLIYIVHRFYYHYNGDSI